MHNYIYVTEKTKVQVYLMHHCNYLNYKSVRTQFPGSLNGKQTNDIGCWAFFFSKIICIAILSFLRQRAKHRSSFFWASAMYFSCLFPFVFTLLASSFQGKTINAQFLRLSHLTTCTYDYEVSVQTARGARSTTSEGYRVHALVR